ncbi:MAG: restriction endonuclease subunit S [Desulfosporosinus sp.]
MKSSSDWGRSGMSCSDWQEVTLGVIAKYSNTRITTDKLLPSNYVSTENMLPNKAGKTVATSIPKGNSTKYNSGQTLFSNIRPYFKKILHASTEGGCSADVLVFEISEVIDDKYFFYYLSQDNFFDYVSNSSRGTKMPRGDKQQILMYPFKYPQKKEQKAIAATLSCLDDKIELNNKINDNLEQMAQAIFKSWFVDFEPFQDGEFVDSELGRIPKGWKLRTLDDVTSKFTTGLNPRKNFVLGHGDNFYVTIKNMGNNQVWLDEKCDKVTDDAIQKINKRSDLKKGDLLFSGIGTIGRVFFLDETPSNWNISESVFTLRPNSILSSEILYMILLSDNMQSYAHQLANGSVQKGIRMADLKRYEVIIPCRDIVENVTSILRPIIMKIKTNQYQNLILASMRDKLLPKLMSGEIRVPIDKVV